MTATLEVQGQTIGLEVARTDEQLATGLMFRDELLADVGMLFELPRPKPQILWTKGLNFPIDIVFLREGKVLLVIPNVPPCPGESCPVYGSSGPVDQVLELSAGRAAELGLEPGERLTIQAVADGG